MNKILLASAIGFATFTAGQTYAADFTSVFTADNKVTGFSYSVDGNANVVDLSGVANLDDWKKASTVDLTIADGSSYQFVWDIVNKGTLSSNNPVSFLGEFSLNGTNFLSDNVVWEVSSAYTNGWETAVLNTAQGTDAFNGGDNIWTKNNSGNAIAGIDTQAQWIWDGSANGTNDVLSFRATFETANITSAVPEPSTYALMLAGLGLVGFMARRRKQA